MAEPRDRETVSMHVTREVSVSRLEKQLLVKVYDILIPVAQAPCQLSPLPTERVSNRRLISSTSRTKGV